MAIKLQSSDVEVLAPLGSFDITSIVKPELGEKVIASGYPAVDDKQGEQGKIEAEVTKIVGLSMVLSKPSILGISGGPVVSERGLVGIIHGDMGTPDHLTDGLVISLAGLEHILFK